MNIQYIDNCDSVDWQQVSALFQTIGWGERAPQTLELAFQKSAFVRFAYDGDKLIGMGRTVDDGAFYAWVVDLAILPEYQGKGIGTKILNDLEIALSPYITTMLTSVPGKEGFYQKQGWCKQSTAYIFPRSDKQKALYSG